MRIMLFFVSVVLASAAIAGPKAAPRKEASSSTAPKQLNLAASADPNTLHVGKWTIEVETDPMTDAKDCTAYYDLGPKYAFQLTKGTFGISYKGRGGIQAYRLRFDEDAASELTIPSDIEKRISAVVIERTDGRFSRLLKAKRLRVQGSTFVSGILNDDIDLSDLPAVMATLEGVRCS